MSNYKCEAFHPERKRVEPADALDDFYGPHRYAIRFDQDGSTFPEGECVAAHHAWRKREAANGRHQDNGS